MIVQLRSTITHLIFVGTLALESLFAASALCADGQPASFGYVLQADRLAKDKAGAVKVLAECDRDWIILDASYLADDGIRWTKEDLKTIRAGKAGRKVIAYLSIGEAEEYRWYWQDKWKDDPPEFLLNENPDWPGNYGVRYWMPSWQRIMAREVDTIMGQGFDGLYLDKVDLYEDFEFDPKTKNWIDRRPNPATGNTYREDMIAWVQLVAKQARQSNRTAMIVPQNASPLLDDDAYLRDVNAIGIEDLFTDGTKKQPKEEVEYIVEYLARMKKADKPVLCVEYPTKKALRRHARESSHKHGFRLLITDRELTPIGESGGDAKRATVERDATSIRPTSFRIYYGAQANQLQDIQQNLARGQVVVVDTRVLTDERRERLVCEAHSMNAKVLAYISIGELAEYRIPQFLQHAKTESGNQSDDELLRSIIISRNVKFESRHVDVSKRSWRSFAFAQIRELLESDVDGLFLDTVDTVDVYTGKQDWSLQRRSKSVTAMISLIREIKAKHPTAYVLQNRGLNLIGPTVFVGNATGIDIPGLALAKQRADNPDGILFESAFISDDDWARLRLSQLKAARQAGAADVFALGYKDTPVSREVFFQKAASHGFIAAWGSSSSALDREVTQLPVEGSRSDNTSGLHRKSRTLASPATRTEP